MPRVTNDVACLWHLAHMCTGKGAKELAVNIEDFVIDIYYHFRRSAKRKAQSIKHVSTRWPSHGKCLKRTLKQWDSLESYFLSYFDLQDDPEADGKTVMVRYLAANIFSIRYIFNLLASGSNRISATVTQIV